MVAAINNDCTSQFIARSALRVQERIFHMTTIDYRLWLEADWAVTSASEKYQPNDFVILY